MKADFYSVQVEEGIYGKTMTIATFKTESEAREYIKTNRLALDKHYGDLPVHVIPQNFGKYIEWID